MLVWNVLPPCLATVCAIALVATVSWGMAASLVVVGGLVVVVMFRRAAAGKPLHHEFANGPRPVDGEMTDVVGNMAIVKRVRRLVARASALRRQPSSRRWHARRRSLLYLERLRICTPSSPSHSPSPAGMGIVLWQRGAATTGDVILVCTLGLSVLHATRDLAVGLVDVTQHLARLVGSAVDAARAPPAARPPGCRALMRHGASVHSTM